MYKAKPFVKWVGGKTQLINQIEKLLPENFSKWKNVTYIEPFVGGGAMLFYMLQKYPNIQYAIINDINQDLTTCYEVVKMYPNILIDSLMEIQAHYYSLKNEENRKDFYLQRRTEFNTKKLDKIRNAALFFFLNRTCFNGLYRVNKSGLFNVPFGKYEKPTICDPDTIYADSKLLQKVEILTGNYQQTLDKAQGNTLFYFDPPYRPINKTSSFNDYAKESFNDFEQNKLKEFCDKVHRNGRYFALSNSDCLTNSGDDFFEKLYSEYIIHRVQAVRNVNSVGSKRGKVSEIVVCNYENNKNIKPIQLELSIG